MTQHIDQIHELLSKTGLQRKSGNIIYSGYETLSPGKYYFLGMNPGGHIDDRNPEEDQIINKLIKKKDYPEENEYFDGIWGNERLPGVHHHQLNIQSFFECLEIDLRTVLSTNLCFQRSPGKSKYPGGTKQMDADIEKFWPIHEYMLSVVQPKVIICNGADARDFFKKKIKPTNIETKELPEKWRGLYQKCTYFAGNLYLKSALKDLGRVKVIATPHLTNWPNFDYYKDGANWLRKKI